MKVSQPIDVTIMGSGISGCMLALLLHAQNVRVRVIDAGAHPRFAIGESTVPHTTMLMDLLARRYGVPELAHIASPAAMRKHVGSNCGVKGNFGYVYHREGQPQSNDECVQLGVTKLFRHNELHYFRQDVDAYLMHRVIARGIEVRQRLKIQDVSFQNEGVVLTSDHGEVLRTRYLVDATGFRSFLGSKLNLRENPTRLRLKSRALFTHMVGVKAYDDCVSTSRRSKMSSPWQQGTLHHVFEGGWLWVIPFNNAPGSTNSLVSVGLCLNEALHPKTSLAPEAEFQEFLERFPEIALQFAEARPVREWIGTDRLQYSSKQCAGDRWCLMPHAAGFVDAYYSRGLVNTMEAIQMLARKLPQACRADDFSAAQFADYDNLLQKLLDHNDRLVEASFASFCDFDLFNAVLRVWMMGTYASEGRLMDALIRHRFKGDPKLFEGFEDPPFPGRLFPYEAWFDELFEDCMQEIEAFREGRLSASAAASRIFANLRKTNPTGTTMNQLSHKPLLWGICDPQTHDIFINAKLYFRPRTFKLAWDRLTGRACVDGSVEMLKDRV